MTSFARGYRRTSARTPSPSPAARRSSSPSPTIHHGRSSARCSPTRTRISSPATARCATTSTRSSKRSRGFRHDEDEYYRVRDEDPRTLTDAARGARLIFLNRTCFNGLWRVNRSGKFNVPFGRYTNPRIVDAEGLRAASAALARAEVLTADFADVTRSLGPGDFVYFDPPYVPVSKTASFTSYAKGGFGPDDQRRLADELARLRTAGVAAVLSNADTALTRDLYRDFAVHLVTSARAINSRASGRGPVGELVVTSWGAPGVHPQEAAPVARAGRVSSRP